MDRDVWALFGFVYKLMLVRSISDRQPVAHKGSGFESIAKPYYALVGSHGLQHIHALSLSNEAQPPPFSQCLHDGNLLRT